jgi:hypothetical protein
MPGSTRFINGWIKGLRAHQRLVVVGDLRRSAVHGPRAQVGANGRNAPAGLLPSGALWQVTTPWRMINDQRNGALPPHLYAL